MNVEASCVEQDDEEGEEENPPVLEEEPAPKSEYVARGWTYQPRIVLAPEVQRRSWSLCVAV
jgi:hypothetical protein